MPRGNSPAGRKKSALLRLNGDLLSVEALPVFEIVEAYGVEDRAVVLESASSENLTAIFVRVMVAGDAFIECLDGSLVNFGALLFADPLLERRVGRFSFHEFGKRGVIDPEPVENRLVETFADSRILAVEFSGIFERNLLPEAGKVKESARACGTGADEWDDLCHDFCIY